MDQVNDLLLTKLCVRLLNTQTNQTVGSGIIYAHPSLHDKVYILTAAHCLFEDSDNFEMPMDEIGLEIFNSERNIYQSLVHKIDYNIVSAKVDQDVAILMLDLNDVEAITGELPAVHVVYDRNAHTHFVSKGFPSAAGGKEIVSINPIWVQQLPGRHQFQLYISQDFSDEYSVNYRVDGFSGAGVFLYDNQRIYLYGIFTRFLDAGKVVYCEPISQFLSVLASAYLIPISYTFFGAFGISPDFFLANAKKSIARLGPRFNAAVNFQLPISFYFNAISKDQVFKQQLARIVDKHLTESLYGRGSAEITEIEADYDRVNETIKKWYDSISWQIHQPIITGDITKAIEEFQGKAKIKLDDLYDKKYKKVQDKDTSKNKHFYPEPYVSEISLVNKMIDSLSIIREELEESHIELSNNPILLIKGTAGSGKSHLLGDILHKRNLEGLPSVLLLGQLFSSSQSVWENILKQLDLNCTRHEFLSTLNTIGEQVGSRVLIMIDAINEGGGKKLWHDEIEGFIHDCSEYPLVGVVVTIRTTYWKTIIPETLKSDNAVTKIDHYGFKGNEYEAVKLFCKHYGIQQPNFPLLNPEYSNPLFLHLICKGVQESSQKRFPQGSQGITKVFGYYLKAVKNKLIRKNDNYEYAPRLLTTALSSFAERCFATNNRAIPLSEAIGLFSGQFPDFPGLSADLIEEGVLIRSLPERSEEYDNEGDEELVYFAYERFGDFYIAGELIKDVISKEDALHVFGKNGVLGDLIKHGNWYNSGILEAFAVLLPERFDIEIFEAFQWVFQEKKHNYIYDRHSLPYLYLNSLQWRTLESISDKKFVDWAQNTHQFRVSNDDYLNFLYKMCAIENHPFNSNRLTSIFMGYSMPKRDVLLQRFFLLYSGKDDDGTAMPINHLVDWAWKTDISKQITKETAQLVGQALCWVLASTHTGLRDQVTKAMVNILQDQIPALIEILYKFSEIDDVYILERIYAVAYGCALRSKDVMQLKNLAQVIYDNVFREGNPPTHLFIRDYCRHIIEFALYKDIELDIPHMNFRPPYNGTLPENYPEEEDLEPYKDGIDEKGEIATTARANNKVIHSVLSWDFGRYTVDSALRNFTSVRFTFENEIEEFRKGLPRGGKGAFKNVKSCHAMFAAPRKPINLYPVESQQAIQQYWDGVDELWEHCEQKLIKLLNHEQKEFYQKKILPYWDHIIKSQNDETYLDSESIKLWITKMVFDLGYDGSIHGTFDDNINYFDRFENAKVERIGKKYQWIAFYQVLGILADNYKVTDFFGNNKMSRFYNGPWDLTYRDIDPSFTTRNDREKYEENDFGIIQDESKWFSPPRYIYWNTPDKEWADTTADLPNPKECMQRTDNYGNEWVYLYSSYKWRAPKRVGDSSYYSGRKEIWYLLQGYLVPRNKYTKTLKWLQEQEFHGRWLPEAYEVSNLLARESYWSPLSKQYQKEHGMWRFLDDSNLKIMLPAWEGIGSLDGDDSGAHFRYKMPNKMMLEKLQLNYADQDGEFSGPSGEIVFSNISPLGCMIRKDVLEKFLNECNLEIIWTLHGEKNAFYKNGYSHAIRKSLSGVLTRDIANMSVPIKITDW